PLALTIAPAAPKAPLSAPQRTFNRLSQQITNTEQALQDWEQAMADTQQRVVTDLLPAQQQYLALRIQLLQQLDGSSQAIKLGNIARETLSQVIVQLAAALIMECSDDTSLREIHQRHGGAKVMDIEALSASLEGFFDFRSGDA
ncbi:J domain-containing protein, partial [Acidithiobacillus ferridurans]|nr:J domain-containing protein [Acidithiobacillus ferridurans]